MCFYPYGCIDRAWHHHQEMDGSSCNSFSAPHRTHRPCRATMAEFGTTDGPLTLPYPFSARIVPPPSLSLPRSFLKRPTTLAVVSSNQPSKLQRSPRLASRVNRQPKCSEPWGSSERIASHYYCSAEVATLFGPGDNRTLVASICFTTSDSMHSND